MEIDFYQKNYAFYESYFTFFIKFQNTPINRDFILIHLS
jgi:hypothetical protein